MPTKSSIIKNYISSCSNGELDKLSNLMRLYPMLKGVNNYNNKSGLYYSVRNLNIDTTNFLISNGMWLDSDAVMRMIYYDWSGSLPSYIFLKKIGNSLYSGVPLNDEQLFMYYKLSCFSHHRIDRLISLIEYTGNVVDISTIIREYEKQYPNSRSKAYLSSVRNLKLKLILQN